MRKLETLCFRRKVDRNECVGNDDCFVLSLRVLRRMYVDEIIVAIALHRLAVFVKVDFVVLILWLNWNYCD